MSSRPNLARYLQSAGKCCTGAPSVITEACALEHSVADLGTPGLDLVAHLAGVDALILIDSVSNGAPAGTVTLYRRVEILRHGPAPVRMDPHSPALSESLLIAELAGEGPKDILLIGVTEEQYGVDRNSATPQGWRQPKPPTNVLAELERLKISQFEVAPRIVRRLVATDLRRASDGES